MQKSLKRIDEIRWYHKVPLKNGAITPGVSAVNKLTGEYLFDKIEFKDRTVIDTRCWDGWFSFEAERRGALKVIALDEPDLRWGGMEGFEFLKTHFDSQRVEFVRGSLFDPPPGRFDVVLCYGVLEHVNDPLTAATNCFQMSDEVVVIETLIFEAKEPFLDLIPPGQLGGDESVFYRMSAGFLAEVARMNGFEVQAKRLDFDNSKTSRGAMLFRRVSDATKLHPLKFFSKPPSVEGRHPRKAEML